MAPAPARAPVVRYVTHRQVQGRVESDRQRERKSREERIEPQHLVVVDQQEIVEPGVLHAERGRTRAVVELGGEGGTAGLDHREPPMGQKGSDPFWPLAFQKCLIRGLTPFETNELDNA